MSYFGTLYRYEVKKIIGRKIVWITLLVMVLILLVSVGGSFFFDSNYRQEVRMDKTYQMKLDGRKVGGTLLKEMQEGYGKVPLELEKYSKTDEYQTYARPYSAVLNFLRQATGMSASEIVHWDAGEQELYDKRQGRLEKQWENNLLSQEEKEFWKRWEDELEQPFTFRYKEGYQRLFDCVYTIGLMVIVAVAICLAGVFPEEHVRKTDQLILSSRHGRKTIYFAKLAAGISVSLFVSIGLVSVSFLLSFILFGTEGFSAAFQLIYAMYSYPLSVGEAVLIAYGIVILIGVLIGLVVMFLSEVFRSSIGTLALVIGSVILTMVVNGPEHPRLLAQLWSYLPGNFVASMFSLRTVQIFGKTFLPWQVVPLFYVLLGGILAFAGKRVFVRYQVRAR